jgi:hypothetical protein
VAAGDVLSIPVGSPLPLSQIAAAHDLVDAGSKAGLVVPAVGCDS